MKHQNYKLSVSFLKDSISPNDFYLREQGLRRFSQRSGQWMEAGLCPFHNDNVVGSFRVNLQSGAYKCFSCEAKGGDILAFTKEKYGLSFPETLQQLAKEWGVS